MRALSEITNFPGNDAWLLGDTFETDSGTLLSGQNLAEYTAIGRVTASGKLKQSVETATDGSEVVIGFIAEAVHADGADAPCNYYKGGRFNKDLAVIDASYSALQIAAMFDRTPITLETPTKGAHQPS